MLNVDDREGAPCYLEASTYPKGAAVGLLAEAAAYETIMFFMLLYRMLGAGELLSLLVCEGIVVLNSY